MEEDYIVCPRCGNPKAKLIEEYPNGIKLIECEFCGDPDSDELDFNMQDWNEE
jgi:uncharacterized Zn finger protein